MRVKVEVGQVYNLNGCLYRIISVGLPWHHSVCVNVSRPDHLLDFRVVDAEGLSDISGMILVKHINEKVIPDIPLDPNLPILMAGHLQDRMRRRGK